MSLRNKANLRTGGLWDAGRGGVQNKANWREV